MKATNSLTQTKEKKLTFSAAITGDSLQNLIKKSVASPEAAARFTGALISAVAATPQLQNCRPATVVAAALRGEGMGLTLGREYYLLPFGDNCAYVIGYKGLIALCLAGNDVADMDCIEVREGEYIGRDKRTKRPKFDFSVYETDEEAMKHPVIGYYAYVELADGRFRFEYMSIPEILEHAQRYSKAFDIEKYNKLQRGELSPQEAERIKQGSPFYSSPDIMFKKTVLRKLLNSGYVRLANSAAVTSAITYDTTVEEGIMPNLDLEGANVIESTGEVVDASEGAEAAESDSAVEESNDTASTTEKRQGRGRKPRATQESDVVSNFFGEEE